MQLSKFLRTILKLDAASCLGIAALVLPSATALQRPLGIEPAELTAAAAALIPVGLFILWLGTRREALPALVWLVIAGNLGWSAASVAAAGSLPQITPIGQLAVFGQAIAVLALTAGEWIGLRQSQKASWQGA